VLADESIRDLVGLAMAKYQLSRGILHRLEAMEKMGWQTNQRSINVVQPTKD